MGLHNGRSVLLISLLAFSLVLVACGATPPTEEAQVPPTQPPAAEVLPTEQPPVRIAVFFTVLGNTFAKAVTDGVTEAADRLGGTVVTFGADPAFDQVAQSNQIQDAIVSGNFDAFIIHPTDGNYIVPYVEQAVAAGIKVIDLDFVIGPDARTYEPCCGMTAFVGRTGVDHGASLAKMAIMACDTVVEKPCKVGYLSGVQALTIDQDRIEAIEKALKEHPDIEMVAMQDAFYSEEKGYEVAQNILRAQPDIDVLFTSGDQMMLGAEQAVIDSGLKGKILLMGNGCDSRGYQAVKEGRWFATFADLPYTIGQRAAEIAIRAARGEEVSSIVKTDEQKPPLPADGPIITQENVDQFEPQW